MTDRIEIIAAFADGEDVAAEDLRAALATDEGRDYLIDVLALRRLVGDPISVQVGRPSRAGAPAGRPAYMGWLTGLAAALVVASATGGFFVGRQMTAPTQVSNAAPAVTVQATPPELLIPAPSPSRVIHLQTGKDWTERAGGN